LQQLALQTCPTTLKVLTRLDLVEDSSSLHPATPVLRVSAASGEGVDLLRVALREQLTGTQSARSELLGTTAVRCRDSLHRTIQSLTLAKVATSEFRGDELVAMEIRQALHELSVILGEVYTDDILDHIFSNFCIGK
jgi:tRNA modification GTPase